MGNLKVGASKKCISPKEDMLPSPQAVLNGDAQYTWVRKDIYVRAIAIDNGKKKLVFIVTETNNANVLTIRKEVAKKNNIPEENVFMCNSHNHSATNTLDLDYHNTDWDHDVPEVVFKYSKYVMDLEIQCANEAFQNMQPARYAYATGNSYINCNRDEELNNGRWIFGRNFERPSDKTLAILKFEDMEGHLIAALMNYAVHATMCFRVKDENGNMCVSGDLAGDICEFMEEAYSKDNAVVAWTIAAAGNQTAILEFFHEYHPDGTYVPDERYNHYSGTYMWKLCEHLAQKQGMDALKIMSGMTKTHDDMKIEVVDRQLQVPGTKVEGFGFEQLCDDRNIDESKIHNVDDDKIYNLRLKLITLDDIALFGVNFEFMCESGLRIKEKSPLKNLMIITCADKSIEGAPYLVDKWGYEHHTPSYYRNGVRDAMTEEVSTEALMEMFEERLRRED